MTTEAAVKKSKFQLRREASYEALVASAMRAFFELGYAATRVEDIVAGTGHTSGSFYFHFKNKADCFWHVVTHREQLRGDWPSVVDGLDPKTTSLESVLHRVFVGFDETLSGVRNWALVTVDFYDAHRGDPEVAIALAAAYERWRGEVRRFLDKLQARGYLEPGKDLELLATQVFAYAEGMTSHADVFGLDASLRERAIIDGLRRLMNGGR